MNTLQRFILTGISTYCLISVGCCCAGLSNIGKPQTFTSDEGLIQITAAGGMSKSKDLNDEADLQLANIFSEIYLLVFNESLEEVKGLIEFSDYDKEVRNIYSEDLSRAKKHDAKSTTIGGHPALLGEMTGRADGIDVHFIIATVDTGDHFHQVVAWTLKDRIKSNRSTLEDAMNSFKLTGE